MPKFYVALVCMLLVFSLSLHGAEQGKGKGRKIRILGVGNSFTINCTKYIHDIAASTGMDIDAAFAFIGGCSLKKHVELIEKLEKNPDDPEARKYRYDINFDRMGTKNLIEMLTDGKWDYITIQQRSGDSWHYDTYQPYADKLIAFIRKYQPDAVIAINETWAYEKDSWRLKEWKITQQQMYVGLHKSYARLGQETGLKIIPVGTAFDNARKLPMWTTELVKDFDPKKYTHPQALPKLKGSLNNGFFWVQKNDKWIARYDPNHAGVTGEYLAALVWYQFFTARDARKATYVPEGITPEQAQSLRDVACETVGSNTVFARQK